jgi:hypothetical protein
MAHDAVDSQRHSPAITSINQAVNGDAQQATDAENQTWSNL